MILFFSACLFAGIFASVLNFVGAIDAHAKGQWVSFLLSGFFYSLGICAAFLCSILLYHQ